MSVTQIYDNQRTVYTGLSTDTKPTHGVKNGDVFQEIDTGTFFLFSKSNKEWYEQTSPFAQLESPLFDITVIPVTKRSDGKYEAEITATEYSAMVTAGKHPIAITSEGEVFDRITVLFTTRLRMAHYYPSLTTQMGVPIDVKGAHEVSLDYDSTYDEFIPGKPARHFMVFTRNTRTVDNKVIMPTVEKVTNKLFNNRTISAGTSLSAILLSPVSADTITSVMYIYDDVPEGIVVEIPSDTQVKVTNTTDTDLAVTISAVVRYLA